MTEKTTQADFRLNPRLLDVLACPSCQGRLDFDANHQRLICKFEKIAYPVENGVPVLVVEKAHKLEMRS